MSECVYLGEISVHAGKRLFACIVVKLLNTSHTHASAYTPTCRHTHENAHTHLMHVQSLTHTLAFKHRTRANTTHPHNMEAPTHTYQAP